MLKNTVLFLFCLISFSVHSQIINSTCQGALPICADTTVANIVAPTNVSPPFGNNYGCLGTASNTLWYYMEIGFSGDLNMELTAGADLDYVIWGPFTSVSTAQTACGNLGNAPNPLGNVDCGFLGGFVEYPSIMGAVSGEIYLMAISNTTAAVTSFTLSNIGGTGSLVCPAGQYPGVHTLSGKVYYDLNQNGIQDTGEPIMPSASINISPLTLQYTTNQNGYFGAVNPASGPVNYNVNASVPGWNVTTTPSQYTFTLDTINYDQDSIDFGFYPNSLISDADIDLIGTANHCITNNYGWIDILNTGTLPVNILAQVTLDTNATFISSVIAPDSVVGNILYYSFDSLFPFNTITNFYTTTLSGSLGLNDTVVHTTILEIHDLNNTLLSTEYDTTENIVVCSYDPNDKTAFPNGSTGGPQISLNDNLEYVVRFQNTGNATAIDVRIEDTIDVNLDLSTFSLISSSHLVDVTIDPIGLVTFLFEDINLPDSTSDEPGSHGYVKYKIEQVSGLLPHDEIQNTAHIYFDLNAPITTNTTLNTIECYDLPDATITQVWNQLIVIGDPDYSYEWFFNGVAIPNSDTNELEFYLSGEYTVIITNEFNCTSTANIVATGIGNLSKINVDFTIHPNPSDNNFNISLTGNGSINSVSVYNCIGQEVFSKNSLNADKIQISDHVLSKGFYFVKITTDTGKTITKKITKI